MHWKGQHKEPTMLKKLCLILALALAVALPAAAQNAQSSGILFASAAQTATVTSQEMDATTYVGVHVIINVTCTIHLGHLDAEDPGQGPGARRRLQDAARGREREAGEEGQKVTGGDGE
jgi:hypothetical protein